MLFNSILPQRFWNKVQASDSGCWLWTGSINNWGYGVCSFRGEQFKVHRLAHETFLGPIPAGLEVDHLCRVRHCVNPLDLEAVTKRENGLRGISPQAQNARKTHCPQGHSYSGGNLYPISTRPSDRRCRICEGARYARSRIALGKPLPSVLLGVPIEAVLPSVEVRADLVKAK